MGLQDFEVFIQERLRTWDGTLDITSGSPIDSQVIQPLLRRLGTDPFTVDAATFIIERLGQEFPDLASSDGDAVTDLLTRPALLLWDPIIREIQRVKNMLSFRDPSILTTDEAEALGANIFAERDRGNYARGRGRIYFAQPQPCSVTSANFFTSRGGLHFFPIDVQSIKAEEMILNGEGDLYYFDVNVIANATGEASNIGPSELVTVANVAAAVRVTNKVRFRFGLSEEDAQTFAGRVHQSLTERSLVTSRGIASRLTESFPEITRLNVVGFNDPEMQRDVLTGGGLGPMLAFGHDAQTYFDGEFRPLSRRVRMPGANFLALIGPPGTVTGFVLTLFDLFTGAPTARDVPVTRVIDATTVEIALQVLKPGATAKAWILRRIELTLSGIPGGILFPDGPTGTVAIAPDKVHLGGCTDMLVRGADFDTSSLVLDLVTDDSPLLAGTAATTQLLGGQGYITLGDLTLAVNYAIREGIYQDLVRARDFSYSLEIIDGADAGVYRILDVTQIDFASPILLVTPAPTGAPGNFRWRLIDELNIDLVDPRETRIQASSGNTTQNVVVFTTTPPTDFASLGVSPGDTLRLANGLDHGDFVVQSVDPPFYTQLKIDRPFVSSRSGLTFTIFRGNKAGGIRRPLMRITGVDLLDTTAQPVGSKVPYAKPVEVRSRAFQNAGNGVKLEVADAALGILSLPEPGGGFTLPAGNLLLRWVELVGGPLSITLGGGMSAVAIANAINAVSTTDPRVLLEIAIVLTYGGVNYLGIVPVGKNTNTLGTGGPLAAALFGDTVVRSSNDIRSATVPGNDWRLVQPAIDGQLDAVWVVDGLQGGFFSGPVPEPTTGTSLQVQHDFAPELARLVRVGSRSIGSARLHFLEPTSMEIDQETVFLSVTDSGELLRFKPDPTLARQLYPSLPNGTKPLNGTLGGGGLFSSAGQDFIKKGIRAGDYLHVDFIPVTGSVNLTDPVADLALKQLRLSLGSQPDKFMTFVNDVGTPGAVSRPSIAEQINAAVGLQVCSIVQVAPLDYRLVFNPTVSLVIRQQQASPSSANVLLGFSNLADTTNRSPSAGTYLVTQVATGGIVSQLTVTPSFPVTGTNQQFVITRLGSQRIVSTALAKNTTTGSLYYWDVELVSEGPGDLWNIDTNQSMVVASYRSDGYYLTTEDPNLTFSPAEKIKMHISRSILEVGVDDDPDNATQITGQSLSINYEYSSLVQSVQSFIGAESERVVNASPLARHLIPHFVRLTISYTGGSKETEVLPVLEAYVRNLQPDQSLESSDLQKIISDKGATSISNPIDLLAIVHNFDRTTTLARSQDGLTTGRLAAFLPDILTLKRRLA